MKKPYSKPKIRELSGTVSAKRTDSGVCPYCRRPWMIAICADGGEAVFHEHPPCPDFERLTAEIYVRVVRALKPN